MLVAVPTVVVASAAARHVSLLFGCGAVPITLAHGFLLTGKDAVVG